MSERSSLIQDTSSLEEAIWAWPYCTRLKIYSLADRDYNYNLSLESCWVLILKKPKFMWQHCHLLNIQIYIDYIMHALCTCTSHMNRSALTLGSDGFGLDSTSWSWCLRQATEAQIRPSIIVAPRRKEQLPAICMHVFLGALWISTMLQFESPGHSGCGCI